MRKFLIITWVLLFAHCAMAAEESKKPMSAFGRTPLAVQEYEKSVSNNEKQPEAVTRQRLIFSASKRDPFVSLIVKKTGPAQKTRGTNDADTARSIIDSLSVQGLIWGGRFSQAIINNKVYKVGDNVQGLIITSIDKNGITFSSSGKKYILNTQPAVSSAKKR